MVFPAEYGIERMIRAIHNGPVRVTWDKDLQSGEIFEIVNEKMGLWHQVNSSAIKIVQSRDFLEKKIFFKHDGAYYIFFSSIPDSFRPNEKNVSRAYTVTGFHVWKEEDGKILYNALNQNDFNLQGAAKLGAAMAIKQIPKTVQAWMEKLEGFLSKTSPKKEKQIQGSPIYESEKAE